MLFSGCPPPFVEFDGVLKREPWDGGPISLMRRSVGFVGYQFAPVASFTCLDESIFIQEFHINNNTNNDDDDNNGLTLTLHTRDGKTFRFPPFIYYLPVIFTSSSWDKCEKYLLKNIHDSVYNTWLQHLMREEARRRVVARDQYLAGSAQNQLEHQ